MIIVKGKHSGFCFGVKRAVDCANKLSVEKSGRIFVLGEIIHNDLVIEQLRKKGVITISNLYETQFEEGDTVIIRTHGEPKSTFDYLSEKGVKVVDCTCPFVKEIQKIVNEHQEKGYKIAIIGNCLHPEVIGINGWCDNSAIITESLEELERIKTEKLCLVVQTTYSEQKFDKIIKNFKHEDIKTLDIFKTICYTTNSRQREADVLSKQCDCVLVIGGANSNNTSKLFDICKANCKNSFRIVNPSDFDYNIVKNFYKVGVVFGASTPIEQFQEVIQSMEEITKVDVETVDCAEQDNAQVENTVEAKVEPVAVEDAKVSKEPESEMDKAMRKFVVKDYKVGQVVTAIISSATDNGLTVSIKNGKTDSELPKDEMINPYNKEDYKDKINTEIRLMVVGKRPLKLSEKAMEKVLQEEAEIEEIKNGKIFEAKIVSTNKGGLTGEFGRYQVFIPASQIILGFVKDLEKYVGKTMKLKAEKVESKGARRQIVASHRVILLAEKEERDAARLAKEQEFFANVQENDVVLGTPVRFAKFGAFVDVNGFDCLAHISDLSWFGCNDCSEVLEIGKQYEFKVLKIDADKKRVSVGYKQLQPKPWDTVYERYNVGDIVTGKVVRIVNFGAFVEVEKGIDGLIYVSQISNKWLENPVTALEVGQEVQAKIMEINPEKERMSLSIKATLPEEPASENEEKKGKGKKVAKKVEENVDEIHEWKDDANGGASIAEMLNK